jgi:hypothetical protein
MDFFTLTIGFLIGLLFSGAFAFRVVKKSVKEAELAEENETNYVGLRVEVDNNMYYCYNNETNQFLCQGRNLEEIRDSFRARFPGVNAYLSEGEESVLTTLAEQLAQIKNETHSDLRSPT